MIHMMGYFSFHSSDGIFIYESNSGRNAIIRKRYTDNEIQREIDHLYDILRERLEG